jgi:hypothetical protein
VLTDGHGIPLGCVVAPANRHDSPLLRPTLEKLGRFGFDLPPTITVHLDAGYDSTHTRDLLAKLGCQGVISKKGFPLQAGARWVVERANSWHNRGFKKLQVCTERRTRVIGRPHRVGQRNHHRPQTHPPSLDHPPLAQPTRPPPVTYLPESLIFGRGTEGW